MNNRNREPGEAWVTEQAVSTGGELVPPSFFERSTARVRFICTDRRRLDDKGETIRKGHAPYVLGSAAWIVTAATGRYPEGAWAYTWRQRVQRRYPEGKPERWFVVLDCAHCSRAPQLSAENVRKLLAAIDSDPSHGVSHVDIDISWLPY